MELPGGDMDDMKDRLTDAEVEALLARSDEADPTLSELMSEIRDFAEWAPGSDTKSSHIVAAVTAAGAAPETGAVGNSLSQPSTRRPWMFGKILSSRLARVMAAVIAVIMATGGMAYAGVLPHPIQSTVSDIVGVVGIDIDDGSASDLDDAEIDQVDDDQVDDVDDRAVIGVDETDVDDINEDQVEDIDDETVGEDDHSQADDDDEDVDDDDHGQISDDDHGKVSDDEDDGADDGDHGTVSDDNEGHGGGHDDSAGGGEEDD